jgi:hypothetical protein
MASNTQSIRLHAACRGSRKIASTWPARRCREYLAAKGVEAICCAFHLFVGSASRRAPQVFVMQSTDARHLHHPTLARQLHTAITTTWSRYSLRIDPITRSAVFCHGERGAITTSRMPSALA